MSAAGTEAEYDLIIVGSGPAGSAIARTVVDSVWWARVLMVEVGPRLGDVDGQSVRNFGTSEREQAERASQGPAQTAQTSTFGQTGARPIARPGTFLLNSEATLENDVRDLPSAAMSANVGGLAAHWTAACPRPGDSERIPLIPAKEMDDALEVAELLLGVTQHAFRPTAVQQVVERELGSVFNPGRTKDRYVQHMPLAATPTPSGRPKWHGTDHILGYLADPRTRPARFELRADTLAREVVWDGNRATGVILEDRKTGERSVANGRAVAVAADSFRSPQLLWASGIRPDPLGRYLNDQPQVMCAVRLKRELVPAEFENLAGVEAERERMTGVSWIPFHDPDYPFHGQIMQRDATPMTLEAAESDDDRPIVTLGCFTTKVGRAEDRVEFSENESDSFGMPAMRIRYGFSDRDREQIDLAIATIKRLVDRMGEVTDPSFPRLVPAGSSLHYQGTVRMGETPDEAVCDSEGRVFGFENLYVAGNGVIPTPTACNPTLTNVALAVRSAHAIANGLAAE